MATTQTVRVEVGAGDAEFTPTQVSAILATIDPRNAPEPLRAPLAALSELLREAVQDIPVPEGCTGHYDDFALLAHDGDTCPIHEGDG